MSKKTIKIILFFCLSLLSYISYGQNNSNSPYSMFGVGDLFTGGYGRSTAMGGVSTPLYSMHSLNPSNPATYAALAPSTFIFEVGLAGNWYTLKSPGENFTKFDGNVRSIAIGFPVTKWWKTGLGLNPVSSIGYNIEQENQVENDTTLSTSKYIGEGGLNSFYIDNSFTILKSFSIGAKVSYLFGSLDRNRQLISNNNVSYTSYNETNKLIFSSFSFGLGAHFHKTLNTNLILNLGASYNFNTDLNTEYQKFAYTSVVKFGLAKIDTIYNNSADESSIQIPKSFSIGASAILFQKLELAVDYQKDNWSATEFDQQKFADNKRFGFGLEYIPDMGSSVYLKLVRYRAGFSYTNSYLMYENEQLKQIGGSLGFGFPLRSGALINIGLIYSHREVPNLDILTENIVQLNLNFSFKANWFVKTKFY